MTAARRAARGHDPVLDEWSANRLAYVDNLKVLLVAGVIAGHAVAGYSDQDFWPYSEMKEVTLSPVTQGVLYAVVAPATLLMIPVLFLVAGLLTPRSLDRKGPGPFAKDRLLRLGIPFLAYVVVLQPALMYPVHPPGETPGSYWYELVGAGDKTLDTGPLWFVGVLLIFSLLYAAGRGRGRPTTGGPGVPGLRGRHLVVLAATVAATTFLVRLAIPLGGSNYLVSLNLWEWPGCAAAFGLGIHGARQGWLAGMPDRLVRLCRRATWGALVGFAAFTVVIIVLDLDADRMWGGWGWPALVFATLESVVVVFGSVWLLSAAQQRLDHHVRWAGPRVSRSAYGAFMLQGAFLIGLAFALRPLPLPAELKALLLAVTAVLASFWLGWLLISRVPGLKRVL